MPPEALLKFIPTKQNLESGSSLKVVDVRSQLATKLRRISKQKI